MAASFREYLIIAVSTYIAIQLDAFAYFQLKDNNYQQLIVATVSAVVFGLILLGFNYSKNFYRFRRAVDPRAKYEGTFLEVQMDHSKGNDKGACYAIFSIEYTGYKTDDYFMKGNSYDAEGELYASWHSRYLKVDSEKGTVDYFYRGDYNDPNGSVKGLGYMTFNATKPYLKLRAPHADIPHSGMGFFLDDGDPPKRRNVEFARLTRQEMKRLCPTIENIAPSQREADTVRAYHQQAAKSQTASGIRYLDDPERRNDGRVLAIGSDIAGNWKFALFALLIAIAVGIIWTRSA
jgi:hypothetical protein